MSSLFDNSIIKRVVTAGYVGKEHYEIVLYNGSSIYVTDTYEMQKLKEIIKEVKDFTSRNGLEEEYYSILTDRLKREGW